MSQTISDINNNTATTPASSSETNEMASSTSIRDSPPPKRRCCPKTDSESEILPKQQQQHSNGQSVELSIIMPDVIVNAAVEECKSCGRQETLLKHFNCPSTHSFCLNCIFNWTQKHVKTKTHPVCLVIDCGYRLKVHDLEDLPISFKDHQLLLQLVELKINTEPIVESIPMINPSLRLKCDKCDLYIDQNDLSSHRNQCPGRSSSIPCEMCFCPILFENFEQHVLTCRNEGNGTLCRFIMDHLENPDMDEDNVKVFIRDWEHKHHGMFDVYAMIDAFGQTNGLPEQTCDLCKNRCQPINICFIKCLDAHALCSTCYREHVTKQMDGTRILTCYRCDYHLQDSDLATIPGLSIEQIDILKNYQNVRVWQSYDDDYEEHDLLNIPPPVNVPPAPLPAATTSVDESGPRRVCEFCLQQQPYGNMFVFNCNCKLCYGCFAADVYRQKAKNGLLVCPLCREQIKHNDLGQMRLTPNEIRDIQIYQQGKLFQFEHASHFNSNKTKQESTNNIDEDQFDDTALLLNQEQCLPKYWTLPMLDNFSRHDLDVQSTEYQFVAEKFKQSWGNMPLGQFTLPPPAAPIQPIYHPPAMINPFPQPANPSQPVLMTFPPQPAHLPKTFGPQPANPPQLGLNLFPPPSNPIQPGPNLLQLMGNPSPTPNPFSQPTTSLQPPQVSSTTSVQPPIPLQPASGFGNQPMPQTHVVPPHSRMRMKYYRHLAGMARPPPPPPPHHLAYGQPNAPMLASGGTGVPKILRIERIQNQRWYKQYSAHETEFRQKLGKKTQQWLFHGCDEQASKNIELECFNRSYAGRHATAFGQGCYFARDALYSHSFAMPDRQGIRRMFMARVLVGKTARGNATMRVPPAGYDTTGDGQSIFVTYHDSQAYAEYLITYQ